MAASWTDQYKSADDLLSAKANAMNRGQALGEGMKAGGWTPEKIQSAIDKDYGGSIDAWWEDAGQYEDLSNRGTWTPSASIDMSGAPDWGTVSTDWNAQREEANKKALELLTQGYDERFSRIQADLENQLTSQGIQRGTEAWDRAMGDFTDAREKAYATAENQAYLTGLNEMSTLFGMDLNAAQLADSNRNQWYNEQLQNNKFQNESAYQDFQMDQAIAQWENQIRNQKIQEDLYQRNLPLNELIALLSGTQVTTPTFTQTNTAQTPYQPYYSGGGGGNNWLSDLMGLGGSLGSAGIMAAFMSSRKIKNIHGKAEGMLEKLRSLEVGRWTYKEGEDKAEHVSPYAEDWAERFGGTGKDISIIDAIGVLTKAIQELADRVDGNDTNEDMESEENEACLETRD